MTWIDLHLDLHYIAASWCSDESGANIDVILAQRADVSRPGVVVNDLLVVRARCADRDGGCELPGDAGDSRADRCGKCPPGGDSESSRKHLDIRGLFGGERFMADESIGSVFVAFL